MKTLVRVVLCAAMAASFLVAGGGAQASPSDPGSCLWATDSNSNTPRTGYFATTDGASWPARTEILAWSPDRSKVITAEFDLDTRQPVVRISNPDGSGGRILTNTIPNDYRSVSMSPDGTKVAYLTVEPGGFLGSVLQVLDVSTGNVTRISDGATVQRAIAWSPNSATLVWAEARTNPGTGTDPDQTDVYSAPANGAGSPVRIIETAFFPASSYALDTVFNPPGSIEGITFSPDGSKLLFTGNDFVGPNGAGNLHDDLWISNADGTNLVRLADNHSLTGPSNYYEPAWSPDGSRIAVGINTFDHRNGIQILRADGAVLRTIWAGNGSSGPKWSPDGVTVGYTTNVLDTSPLRQQMRVSNADTGSTRTIWTNPEDRRFIFPTVDWVPCTASMPLCNGKPATIIGTNGPDRLRGTKGRDVVVAFGGNDNIKTFGGNDLVCAGSGSDRVWTGKGKDRAYGGAGKDIIKGGSGNDRLYGEAGKDNLVGGAGKDRLYGAAGKDNLKGGSGNDLLNGGKAKDKCSPGPGNDRLRKCP